MFPATFQRVLLVALFIGLAVANFTWIVQPIHRWAVVHTVYSEPAIRQHDIRIVQLIRPHAAVFSNGERHDYGIWPELLVGLLWLGGLALGAGMLAPVARLLLPAAHADFYCGRASAR